MKTSNYIFIGFILFFFGTITALHIDSKLYEETHLKLEKEKIAIANFRRDFHTTNSIFDKDKSFDNWIDFIDKSKLYFANNVTYQQEYNTVCWTIFKHYKNYDDNKIYKKLNVLKFAKDWAKKGVELNPKDGHMHETYANILFDLGFVDEAIKHQQTAYNIIKDEGHQFAGYYRDRLRRFKAFKKIANENVIKIGSQFIDATPIDIKSNKINLSETIKGKVAILSFWSPATIQSSKKVRLLLPIYNEFKSKDFIIVGITDGYRPNQPVRNNILKENLPWINLVDFEMQDRIWDRYRVINEKNRLFIINKSGTVIMIDPAIEELRAELKKLLKQ